MEKAITILLLALMLAASRSVPAQEAAPTAQPAIVAPQVATFIPAVYPESAIRRGIEGTVKLELVINKEGRVDSAVVIAGLVPELDEAALAAVKRFEFTPALANGQPITVAIEYGYVFSLSSVEGIVQEYVNYKGQLREKGTRTPVAEAAVVVEFLDTTMDKSLRLPFGKYLTKIGTFPGQKLEEGNLVALTDEEGRFEFKSLPACSVRVSFPVAGYQPASFTENLAAGRQIVMDYRISRENYDEFEIVVHGQAERKEVAKTTLSVAEIKRVPGFGGDAIKVVRALPGVARPSFISGEILIRGSGPEDSRFLLDGVTIYRLFHFGAIRSVYNADLLSAIDLYRGGFGARYGGAIGGVVEVKGRPAQTDRWHGKLDLNLMDVAARVEGPVSEKVGFQASGTYSYIGDVIREATKGEAMAVAPLYRDAYARLDWKASERNKAFLTYSTSVDNLEIITPDFRGGSGELTENTSRGGSDDWFHLALLGLNTRIGSASSNELRFSLVQSDASGSFFGAAKYSVESKGIAFRDELNIAVSDKFSVKPGVDLSYEGYDFLFGVTSQKGIVKTNSLLRIATLGAYTNVEYHPFPRWLVIPGIRYDYFPEVEDGRPGYRIASRYEYRDGLTLKGAAGTYSQSPKFTGITSEGLGNPDLPLTEAVHYVAGHEWKITDLTSLDVQGFFNTQSHIPNATDSLDPVTGRDLNYVADMDARMYGMEVLLRQDRGQRFFGWISYTLSRSERRSNTPFAPELYTGNDDWDKDAWVLSKNDQTHNLQLVGGWRLPAGWEAGLRFQYITGNPTSPLKSMTGNVYIYDSETRAYLQQLGDPFSERVGPFVQLDLRVDKRFVYRNWMLSSYLDFSNVNYFFYNSPEMYAYNYDSSKRKSVGAIFFPSLGLTAEF